MVTWTLWNDLQQRFITDITVELRIEYVLSITTLFSEVILKRLNISDRCVCVFFWGGESYLPSREHIRSICGSPFCENQNFSRIFKTFFRRRAFLLRSTSQSLLSCDASTHFSVCGPQSLPGSDAKQDTVKASKRLGAGRGAFIYHSCSIPCSYHQKLASNPKLPRECLMMQFGNNWSSWTCSNY